MAAAGPVSPLAPKNGFPRLPTISGVEVATAEAGVRYKGRTDVMLIRLQPGTSIAGVFTRSATRSAPVLDCQSKLGGKEQGSAGIIVNSGNSNAFTGKRGDGSYPPLWCCSPPWQALDKPIVPSQSSAPIFPCGTAAPSGKL